jgi:voltage-gated potassium channel
MFHLVCRWRALGRKSIAARLMIALLALVFGASVVFYWFERGAGGSGYRSYVAALRGVFILVFSGSDVQPPVTAGGWISAFFMLIAGIVFVTMVMGDSAAYVIERRLKGAKGMGRIRVSDHIMICNWNQHGRGIVDELLSDHNPNPAQIVIVAEVDDCPYDDSRVQYVKGSPTKDEVLERASIDTARTVIVLGGEGEPTTADSRAILTALAVETRRPEVYTCVLIFDPENRKHLVHAHADEILCVSDMTDKVLIKSALSHGLTRVLSELLTFSEGCEVYKVKIPERMSSRTFAKIAEELLTKDKITLLSIEAAGSSSEDQAIIMSANSTAQVPTGSAAFVVGETFPLAFEAAD